MFQVVPEAGLVEVSHLEPRVSEEFQAVAIGVIKRMAQWPSDSARNPGLTSDTRVSTFLSQGSLPTPALSASTNAFASSSASFRPRAADRAFTLRP